MIDQIICGDCLEVMPQIEDKSVDMILADLPYGVTACKWDTPLPLDDLWREWLRLCKGAIVLTATQPFTTTLINSHPELFKYEWIWDKNQGSNFLNVRYMPFKQHENILLFYNSIPTYNPQYQTRTELGSKRVASPIQTASISGSKVYGFSADEVKNKQYNKLRLPSSVQHFNVENNQSRLHPTQKPVALFEYLIRTYTNEGDTVLDPTVGSGTTAVACRKSNRHYICIEKEPEYCKIAEKRLAEML